MSEIERLARPLVDRFASTAGEDVEQFEEFRALVAAVRADQDKRRVVFLGDSIGPWPR